MAVNPPSPNTLDFQAFYFPPGAAIKFPLIAQIAPFTPNAISINNRTALNLQFGPTSQGPFIPAGTYTLNIYPWTYGPSLFVTSLSGSLQATDFLDVHFLSVNTPGGVGVPQITASAPAGWGPVGPTNALVNVNSGDPFNYGQVQQLINLATGVMTGQIMLVANEIQSTGPNADFKFFDRDGGGSDAFTWFANAGLARLFPSALGIDAIQVDELGNLFVHARIETNATGASAKPLLNWVLLTAPTGTGTSGTGNHAITGISLAADVPTSAVAVAVEVLWTSPTVGGIVAVGGQNPETNSRIIVPTAVVNLQNDGAGILAMSGQQVFHRVSALGGADAWSLTIVPTAYAEAS